MSLAGSERVNHPVAAKGVEFLLKSQRADGSWPIDTDLATWVTTLAVNAMSNGRLPIANLNQSLPEYSAIGHRPSAISRWLLDQQYRERAVPSFVTYGPKTRREFLNLKAWGG